MANFKDINFGLSSAEAESIESPDLLLSGYLQQDTIIDEIKDRSKFLVLGYKGSGKSALVNHLCLFAAQAPENNLFVKSLYLENFPYARLKKVAKGDFEPESRYPIAWSWVLLLHMFESLYKNQTCEFHKEPRLQAILEILKSSKLWPLPSLYNLVILSSRNSFSIILPDSDCIPDDLDILADDGKIEVPQFIDYLKIVLKSIECSARHFVIVDGLDDVMTMRNAQLDAIAALVFEMNRLNAGFQKANANFKFVMVCRTDLYDRLSGANKNKIKQDFGISINWYSESQRANDSLLAKLLNLRANLSDSHVGDIFKSYFPYTINTDNTDSKEERILPYLLTFTRHTPRDIIQLMKKIQKYSSTGKIQQEQIIKGTRSYSTDYFIGEIRDELVGYLSDNDIDRVVDLLGSMRARGFKYQDLESKAKEYAFEAKLKEIIDVLFTCSAIGNVAQTTTGKIWTFRYRNPNATVNLREDL
jgi:hypothetical protein